MERLSATSRNDIAQVYRENAFFMVVSHICMPYARGFDRLRLLPEEVFQLVMAWLDRISREEDDDEVEALIDNAWHEQRLELGGMGGEASEGELDRATGIVMTFLLTCLIKLGRRPSAEGDFYASLRDSLMGQMMGNMAGFPMMLSEITNHPYYRKHNLEVDAWLGEYMFGSTVTFTDREGRLRTSLTRGGKQKGRKASVLFALADGEKDEATTQHWAQMFNEYLASRHRSSEVIDSRKDSIILRSIHAFKQYWEDELGLELSQSGSAYLAFLMGDCGLSLGEKEDHTPIKPDSVSDAFTRLFRTKLKSDDGDLLKLQQFLSLRKMQ